MFCPRCKTGQIQKTRAEKHEVFLDLCSQCRGVWFDAGRLRQILHVSTKGLKLPVNARYCGMECPRCKVPLHEFRYPQTNVMVDMCRDCHGIWFDGKEFAKIKSVQMALQQRRAEAGPISRLLRSIFERKSRNGATDAATARQIREG